jgi:hypothetical protein
MQMHGTVVPCGDPGQPRSLLFGRRVADDDVADERRVDDDVGRVEVGPPDLLGGDTGDDGARVLAAVSLRDAQAGQAHGRQVEGLLRRKVAVLSSRW